MVKVHSFKVWDHEGGVYLYLARKSTAERIEKLKGEIIPGTDEEVSESVVYEGRYDPERNPN